MIQPIDTLLLLALPASGKSEVRKYLDLLDPEKREKDFHLSPTVQIDDYPYVHLMRRIDDVLTDQGHERIFFHAGDRPFRNPLDWGTLIELLNQDHAVLVSGKVPEPEFAGRRLLERVDGASVAVGGAARLRALGGTVMEVVAREIETEARDLLAERRRQVAAGGLRGKTLVIEFARGGPDGSAMPLPEPLGYRYSLSRLRPEILDRASILYIWVTPEESRRKNVARTDPNDPGSILHHGVPEEVMLHDYGCDDLDWMESVAVEPGTIPVEAYDRTFHVPIARFDNRVDKTSFLRDDPSSWKPDLVAAVHEGLRGALADLADRGIPPST